MRLATPPLPNRSYASSRDADRDSPQGTADESRTQSAPARKNRPGVRQPTLSDIDRGRVVRIELQLIDRLAKGLGVDPGELFKQTRR